MKFSPGEVYRIFLLVRGGGKHTMCFHLWWWNIIGKIMAHNTTLAEEVINSVRSLQVSARMLFMEDSHSGIADRLHFCRLHYSQSKQLPLHPDVLIGWRVRKSRRKPLMEHQVPHSFLPWSASQNGKTSPRTRGQAAFSTTGAPSSANAGICHAGRLSDCTPLLRTHGRNIKV